MPNHQKDHIADWEVLQQLTVFIKPYRSTFYLLTSLTFLLGVLIPLQPYLIQITIDHHIALKDDAGLVRMAGLLLLLLCVQSMVQYHQTYLADWLGQHVIRDIRVRLYTHTLQLRTSFFKKTPVGRLVTINISDTETLANVFSEGMAALIGDLLQIIFMIAFMLYINWRLALISMTTLPLITIATYIFKERIKCALISVRHAVTQLNIFVQERIVGMSTLQIFGREQRELERFKVLNEVHKEAGMRAIRNYVSYFPLLGMLNSASVSLLVWYGAQNAIHGLGSSGQLIAFLMYINLFFRPLHRIADRFNTLQMGLVSMRRIAALLENEEQVTNTGRHEPERLRGAITFQHVWFAYKDKAYVLQDLSFQIEAQQSLAIVGATGAGKSTISHLLTRFYDVQQGVIHIDGINIKDYEVHALRRQIGIVLQDVFLFAGSIYDNITLGNRNIPKKRVMEAMELIGMHRFVSQLPGGYHYNVMERGLTLSAGQRQLLAFARVLVYDPRILILDEATAFLDAESEQRVQEAMTTLMQHRTCLLIAHRLTTIQHADHILVLKHGKIHEVGTHATLLAQGGDYAALYQAS